MDLSAQDTMDSWPECSEVLPASSLPVHAVHGVSQAHFRHGSRRESDLYLPWFGDDSQSMPRTDAEYFREVHHLGLSALTIAEYFRNGSRWR